MNNDYESKLIKYNKIINSTAQDIHCDISGFAHKLIDPGQGVIGFDTLVLQHISNSVADLDNFIENFIKNTPDYRDYHLETRYETVTPPESKLDNLPNVYTSKIVTEFVKNDREQIKDEFY